MCSNAIVSATLLSTLVGKWPAYPKPSMILCFALAEAELMASAQDREQSGGLVPDRFCWPVEIRAWLASDKFLEFAAISANS
jgi:hypothetical protein